MDAEGRRTAMTHTSRTPSRSPRRRAGIDAIDQALVTVWQQVLIEKRREVELKGKRYPVGRTRSKRLRTVGFEFGRYGFFGIEQNPGTASRWATLARQGKRIMQFRHENRYVANVCDGNVFCYPAWQATGLPTPRTRPTNAL
jgi:hypothetical protein